jgi:hypothetical protein
MTERSNNKMNVPFRPQTQRAPDLLLAGEAVEQIIAHLNNAIIFAKSQDGSMRPFIDPAPIIQIISGALQHAVKEGEN